MTRSASEGAISREKFKLLGRPVLAAVGTRIFGGGRPLGVLVLADKEVRRGGQAAFDAEDGRFLVSLAGLCGMAIENRRHLEQLTRERERLEEENRRLLDETGRSAAGRLFVGDSPAARRVLDLVSRVATSRTSVLLTGESGTGKELVARMIHARSDRADKPFVAINCAALPETLLESELFGIERGVATGVEARSGKFETAQGGTLFLDEIGDMPPSLAGQAAARPPGARDRAGRRPAPRSDRRPRARGDERPPAGTHRPRGVPGGPLLPAPRRRDPPAAAPRAARGHSRSSSATSSSGSPRARAATRRASTATPTPRFSATTFRATSASSRTSSKGRPRSRREARSGGRISSGCRRRGSGSPRPRRRSGRTRSRICGPSRIATSSACCVSPAETRAGRRGCSAFRAGPSTENARWDIRILRQYVPQAYINPLNSLITVNSWLSTRTLVCHCDTLRAWKSRSAFRVLTLVDAMSCVSPTSLLEAGRTLALVEWRSDEKSARHRIGSPRGPQPHVGPARRRNLSRPRRGGVR